MLIDWFTVGAQALNFLILVWLMRHFLYRPVLTAIDAREKRIAAELADAATQKADARKEHEQCQHQQEEFDRQRGELLSKATDEAKAERARLIDQAKKDADALSAQRQAALQSQAHELNQALSLRAQQEVFAIAGKMLVDLASSSLEAQATEVFLRRLRAIGGPAKETLATALQAAPESALVRSAFELPTERRAAVQQAVNETFSANLPLHFETAPRLIAGIELTAHGQKVAWSIADYLAELERATAEVLKQSAQPVGQEAAKPAAGGPAQAPAPEAAAA
jgi:F-type H+-transporting ATPase subunit b